MKIFVEFMLFVNSVFLVELVVVVFGVKVFMFVFWKRNLLVVVNIKLFLVYYVLGYVIIVRDV